MEIKFEPEVKKSLSEPYCPVLSRSDLDDHKDFFCTHWKARSLETVPRKFGNGSRFTVWPSGQEKHGLWSPEVARRKNNCHHQEINPFHLLYIKLKCVKLILENFQPPKSHL